MLFGYDFMLDEDLKPWLIEVNQSPSFATDSPLDYKTKKAVLTDTFTMLNCSVKRRKQIQRRLKKELENRILTGKQPKLDPIEKARVRKSKLAERWKFENQKKGQWELILPWPDKKRNANFKEFIKKA